MSMFKKMASGKTLKRLLIGVILVICTLIAIVFFSYRRILDRPDVLISSFNKEANISLDRIYQTATKDGITQWRLEAASAHYRDKSKRAFLKELAVTFLLEDGNRVDLTADTGIVNSDSNDIEAAGNVLVSNKNYRLRTQKLFYEHGRRVISSQSPVDIRADTFDLQANVMTYDLNTSRTVLSGAVKGTFVENFQL